MVTLHPPQRGSWQIVCQAPRSRWGAGIPFLACPKRNSSPHSAEKSGLDLGRDDDREDHERQDRKEPHERDGSDRCELPTIHGKPPWEFA